LIDLEIIREQRRMLNRSIRELARERNSMKRDEAKLVVEIKKMAKQNKIV
jgi:charged multivesicular body protein 2A